MDAQVDQREMPAEVTPAKRTRISGQLSSKRRKTRKGKLRLLTLDLLDARTAAYAGARKSIERLSVDMGGDDRLSEGEKQLIQHAAIIGAIATDFETCWVAGQPCVVAGQKIEFSDYLQAAKTQCRLLVAAGSGGIRRIPRDVADQSLAEILRQGAEEVEAEAVEQVDAD